VLFSEARRTQITSPGALPATDTLLSPGSRSPLRRKGAQKRPKAPSFFAPLCALAVTILGAVKKQNSLEYRLQTVHNTAPHCGRDLNRGWQIEIMNIQDFGCLDIRNCIVVPAEYWIHGWNILSE
jgi:hypothetical protein